MKHLAYHLGECKVKDGLRLRQAPQTKKSAPREGDALSCFDFLRIAIRSVGNGLQVVPDAHLKGGGADVEGKRQAGLDACEITVEGLDPSAEAGGVRLAHRSEEHTSELQ